MAPKHSAEVLVSAANCRKAVICLIEKIHMLDMLCFCIIVLLAMSSGLVNQQCSILNKVSLNRNI